jgi:hypothetical protein
MESIVKVLCFESGCAPLPLTVPEIVEQLWRIADESRQDPAMQDFADTILVALHELVRLREAAHAIMLEANAAGESSDRAPARGPGAAVPRPRKRQAVDPKWLADSSA